MISYIARLTLTLAAHIIKINSYMQRSDRNITNAVNFNDVQLWASAIYNKSAPVRSFLVYSIQYQVHVCFILVQIFVTHKDHYLPGPVDLRTR